MAAIVVVLALAGAATALAAARDPGVPAPAPERIARSAVHSVTNAPEADATGGAPWSAHRVSPDSTSTLSETGVPETGVPSKAAAPPDSPTAPSLVQTGPVGADAVLETVNSPALPEGPGLQVNAAARAARDAAGRNGAGPPAQAAPVTSFDITLSPGANLISLPLVPDDIGIEAVLTGILDRVETVWQYDTSGPAPRWRSYAPGAPSDLRVMRDGPGYWVHLKQGGDAVLTVTGREAAGPARRVARGWNLVGFTATSPQAPGEYLGALSGSAGAMVGYAGGAVELVLPSAAPPQLMPGRGYWLYLESAGTIGGAPLATMAVPADREEMVALEHDSGAKIEIPPGATVGGLGEDSAETVTVAIKEVGPPSGNVLPVKQVFDFSIVDQYGEEVPLQKPVMITLPYTLPAGKNAGDLVLLHWNEDQGKWGDVEISEIDEENRLATVQTISLSNWATTFFLSFTEFITMSAEGIIGGNLKPQYDNGLKHLVSLHGEQGIPVAPFGFDIEVGQLKGALILDVDDLARITQEGKDDYVTFWVNVGATLISGSLLPSLPIGISYSLHTMDHATNQHDPAFNGEFSLATISSPTGSLTVNENGRVHPIGLQREVCVTCTSFGGISLVEVDVNFIRGELNTKSFVKLLSDTLKPENFTLGSVISPTFLATELLTALLKSFNELDEDVVAPFTYFDDPSPRQLAKFDRALFNRINGAKGGLDRTGDGREDLVFPSLDSEGEEVTEIPLELIMAPDLRESREYYVQLLEATEGWEVKVNPDGQPEDGQEDRYELEADALFPVTTNWLVNSEPAAVDPGVAKFALLHKQNGETETVHEEFSVQLRKERILSDLHLEVYSNPYPVRLDETFTYYLTVANRGPEPADDVRFRVLGLHGGQSLSSATTPDGRLRCQEGSNGSSTCELGGMAVGQKVYVQLDFPPPDEVPPTKFVAVPVMLQVQSDGEELQTEGFRMGDTFAVPLKADPAPENNLAILRTGVRFRDTVTGNPNCFLHLYCLTSQEVDLAQADKAVLEEFGDEWRVGRWSDEDRGPRRASYDWQGKSATVESLLNTGDAVHLRWNGNAHDATGHWYFMHRGGLPDGIEAHDATGGLKLISRDSRVGRVLAVNRKWRFNQWRLMSASAWSGNRRIERISLLPSGAGQIGVGALYRTEYGWGSCPSFFVFGPELSHSGGLGIYVYPQSTYTGNCRSAQTPGTGVLLPPNPTSKDRTYKVTVWKSDIPGEPTQDVVVSAYPRWVSDAPNVAPATLESDGGSITVEIATHEFDTTGQLYQITSPPEMSISGPGLAQSSEATENASGCAGSESTTYRSRCWSTTFELPANDSSSVRTYEVIISAVQIPVDLTAEVVVPAAQ